MFLYNLYKLFSYLFLLPAPFYLLYRLIKKKENKKSYLEKLSITRFKQPHGKLIWFHAASVGELKSIIPLLKVLEHEVNILVTTVTITSYQVFKKEQFTKVIHQFLPFDVPCLVKRFLNHWKPILGVFVDSELWPNLIETSSKRKIILMNINAKLSDRSYQKWRKIPTLASYLYNKFSSIIACSNNDLLKISNFTNTKKIQCFGNLKYSSCSIGYDEGEYAKVSAMIKSRSIWLAASTHKGEEESLIRVHKKLLKKYKNLLLIIVPRHPQRGQDIASIATNLGLKSGLRSQGIKIDKSLTVYIADTIGELGIWYRLSNIVFVGGSLIPHGGQNILEPASVGSAIIVGTNTGNFKEIINSFKSSNALIEVHNEKELLNNVEKLFADQKLQNSLIKAALNEVKKTSEVLDKVLKVIKDNI